MITYDTDIGTTKPRLIQFENVNEGRSYPFEDNAVLEDTEGKTLADNIITDLHMVIPTGTNACLSNVYISENMISACLKITKDNSLFAALSVIVHREDLQPYMPYRLDKLTGSEDVGGIITFGNIDLNSVSGSYRFNDNKVLLSESAITRYEPAQLRKIIDDRTGEYLYGDVNINFSNYIDTARTENKISLTLKSGAAEALLSKCDKNRPVNTCGATPVTSINGIAPDENNRFVIWFH